MIPADGGFLPLDAHLGREMIVAFVTAQPVEALTRLMLRMEGFSKDPSAARNVLVSAGYELAHISFGHDQYNAVAASSPNLVAGVNNQLDLKPTTQAQENGVLGGLGSRIAQFTGQSKAPQSASSKAVADDSKSSQKEEVVATIEPAHESTSSGFGAIFGGLFGSNRDTPPPLEAESRRPARTFALPVERQVSQQLKQRELASTSLSETQSLVPAPSASSELALELAKQPSPATATGRLVEPSPVESTLYSEERSSPAVRTPAPQDTALSADGRVQSTLARLFTSESNVAQDTLAEAPATKVTAQTDSQVSESPAQLAASPTVAAPSQLSSVVSEPAVPRLAQEQSSVAAETRAATPAPAVRAHDQPTAIASVNDADTLSKSGGFLAGLTTLFSGGDSDKPQIDVAIKEESTPSLSVEPERSSESAPPLAATEQADLSAPVRAAPQVLTTPPLPKPESSRVPESVVQSVARSSTAADDSAVDSASQSSSLLSGLTALFSGGSSDTLQTDVAITDESAPSASVDSERPSEPAPSLAVAAAEPSRLSAPVPAAAQVLTTPPSPKPEPPRVPESVVQAEARPSTAAGDGAVDSEMPSSGLLSGLTALFSGGDSDALQTEATVKDESIASVDPESERPSEPASPLAVVAAQPPRSSASVPAAPSEVEQPGGLFAGLGALLGSAFSTSAPTKPQSGKPLVVAPSRTADARVNTGAEPRIKLRTDQTGREVVTLSGPIASQPRAVNNQKVLSGAGRRIRRLLDEPEINNGSDSSLLGLSPTADNSPSALAVVDPEVTANAEPVVVASASLPPARVQAPAAAPSSSQAASETVIFPDPVQIVLANESATVAPVARQATVSAATQPFQQVAMLSGAPARAVAGAAAQLAVVDLNSNSGIAAAVVLVVTGSGSTSGVLVDHTGHILTNWHTVHDYDEVIVMFKQAGASIPALENRMRARVVAHSKYADLALLKVESVPEGLTPAVLVDKVVTTGGAPIHAIGHAGCRASTGQWQHDIAKMDRVRLGSSWYSTKRVLHRGDVIRSEMTPGRDVSGAALFNNQLQLIGLGAVVRTDKGEITGVAARTIRTFLAGAG